MKTKIKLILVFVSTFLLLSIAFGQSSNTDKNTIQKIKEVVNKAVELELFSGTILVAKDGEVIISGAYGDASKDFNVKNTIDTKFDIGSIQKSFTATAIMILAQKGLLNVSDPVIKYLPDFPFGDKITLHHLLTHTAGFGDYIRSPRYDEVKTNIYNVKDLIPIIYDDKLIADVPGEKFSYSNSGIIILGAIIEEVSGISYSQFLQDNILTPLKMENTIYARREDVVENRAEGYIKQLGGGYINYSQYYYPPTPAGGFLSTVNDMLLFDQALYGNDLLNEEYKKLMFTPFKNNYAYCWYVKEKEGKTVINHTGSGEGVSAFISRYVDDKYTLILLVNGDRGVVLYFAIDSIILDKEYEIPKVFVGEYLYPILKEKSIEEVIANSKEILSSGGYTLKLPNWLNDAGYNLIDRDVEMAIKFFIVNTVLFEDDANAFDSLGEAYMRAGKKELAIENYEKSLKLNPKNENAERMLKKMRSNK